MTEVIFVKPKGRVRQPERQSVVMPGGGAYVPRNAYYERLLAIGAVTACDPPKRASKQSEAKTEPKSGRRSAGASQE